MSGQCMYPNWESHPPTVPPDNKIRCQEGLISLTDIRGLIPTMADPVIWVFSEEGRSSVLNAAKLPSSSVPDGGYCSHEQDEDCDRDSGCSWDADGPSLTLLTANDDGGMYACHRVAFDYMMLHDTFREWEASVAAASKPGSWDDIGFELTYGLIRMAVNRRMVPDSVRAALGQGPGLLEILGPRSGPRTTPVAKRVATYFVQAENGGLVKIGKSNSVRSRLTALQTGSPVRLTIIGAIRGDRESELHLRFKHLRSHGEWFKPNASLLVLIETEGSEWELVDRWCSGKEPQ